MVDTFAAPTGSQWVGVSTRLRTMRRTLLLTAAVPCVVALTAGLFTVGTGPGLLALVLGLLATALGWISIGRNWRSWGFTERADDLIVMHGAMFKRLVVVPYGRMQLVDVEAGPIERIFGIVTVKLHTAAATTDARVSGLASADAATLRDRLTALGEAHAAGL